MLPLVRRQVAIRELFPFQEHLDDPKQFVAGVKIRFFDLIAAFSVHALHGFDVLPRKRSKLGIPFSVDILLTLFVFHVLVHHLQNLLAASVSVGLRRVEVQKRTNHAVCTAEHFQVRLHRYRMALNQSLLLCSIRSRLTNLVLAKVKLLNDLFEQFVVALGFEVNNKLL